MNITVLFLIFKDYSRNIMVKWMNIPYLKVLGDWKCCISITTAVAWVSFVKKYTITYMKGSFKKAIDMGSEDTFKNMDLKFKKDSGN